MQPLSHYPKLQARLDDLPSEVNLTETETVPVSGPHPNLYSHVGFAMLGAAVLYGCYELYRSGWEEFRWSRLIVVTAAAGLVAWALTPSRSRAVEPERIIGTFKLTAERRAFIRDVYRKSDGDDFEGYAGDSKLATDAIYQMPILYPVRLNCNHWLELSSFTALVERRSLRRGRYDVRDTAPQCPLCRSWISREPTYDDKKAVEQLDRICQLVASAG